MNEIWVTPEQYRLLEEEIAGIESRVQRAADAAGAAAEHGDLSDNAELDAAREDLDFFNLRLREARDRLARSRVLRADVPDDGKVRIGAKVRVRDLDRGSEETYRLVGGGAFDPDAGEIPYTGPLGKALLGRASGETVEVKVPAGTLRLSIVEVSRD